MLDHDLGLAHDLKRLLARRRALSLLAGAGAIGLVACGGSSEGSTTSTAAPSPSTSGGSGSTGTSTSTTASCAVIPEETAGPYPGDGSNTSGNAIANALLLSGIVRSDIRSSIAGATGVAQGVPLTVQLKLFNYNGSCAATLSGYAIYLWHCDREGRYSMYSSGVTAQNYLRCVQVTGDDGVATFATIFPGCYSGRMPHIHFEVYRSLATASSYSNKLRTSQLALPADVSSTVYNTASGYSASVINLSRISFTSDNVFSDGVTSQLATVSGSVAAGYLATLNVAILA